MATLPAEPKRTGQGTREYEREAGRVNALLRLKEEFLKDVRRHGSQFMEKEYIPITRTIAPTRAQEAGYKKAIIEYLRRQLLAPSLRRLYDSGVTYREDVTAVSTQLERIVQFVDDPL